MGRAVSGWVIIGMTFLFLGLCLGSQGCTRTTTEADLLRAKSVVQRVLVSDTYEDFMSHFTKQRQARMQETAIWIRWWQEKISKDKTVWKVVGATDIGGGVIEVVVQHRRRETSRQYYRLVYERQTWAIQEIESER